MKKKERGKCLLKNKIIILCILIILINTFSSSCQKVATSISSGTSTLCILCVNNDYLEFKRT